MALMFVAFFIALSAGFVYWQVVVAQQVTANFHNGRPCLLNHAPMRGRILDRNGVVLAYSVPAKQGCGYKRVYTDLSLAGLIGYYVSPYYPATGIEAQFNAYLSGQIGTTTLENTVNQTLHRSPIGDDIYLTIDDRIQKLVDQHFDDPIVYDNNNTFTTNRGAVIVSDPHTGKILAMLSRPTYDPNKLVTGLLSGSLSYYNQLVQDPDQPLLEKPLKTFIPGSVYKTVTLMAALESGNTTLSQTFDQQQALGPYTVGGEAFGPAGNNIAGYTVRFPVSTEYGYVHSDNIIYAQIGAEAGSTTWMAMNRQFFVGSHIPFDLPVAMSTVQKQGQALNKAALAEDAFGQGFDVISPLEMTLVDNTVAANGQLMRPMLISKIVDKSGHAIQSFSPQQLSAPVSRQTATDVRQAMQGVTLCGSGSVVPDVINSPWGIIGKTGTGQVSDNGKPPANSWMVTQAPYSVKQPGQLPVLTIVAMKQNGGDGGPEVGPMIVHMYRDIFSHSYVKAQQPAVPLPGQYCCSKELLQIGCSAP
jgi:cell division protein FtsI/penicillin-binding protein 2